jgi:hypothetical protein
VRATLTDGSQVCGTLLPAAASGIRGIDEHTKLARAALYFDTDLDSVFNVNVAKMP